MFSDSTTTPIYFVVRKIPDLLRNLLAEKQILPPVEEFMQSYIYQNTISTGEAGWIVQTFLWMKQLGLNVALVEQPVENAICIAHCDAIRDRVFDPHSFVVGIRGDRPPLYMCELELVQNPKNLRKNSVHINYWPQFKLLHRDPGRRNRIERISFFGTSKHLDQEFRDPSFVKDLKKMDVELNICANRDKWNDYRETDLILAVRKLYPLLLDTKPASKLINAWRAGSVALLGEESAFRAIGMPNEDYFEVNNPHEVLQIVDRLKRNPALYERMRQAGLQRSLEFSFERIQQEWINLLNGKVSESFEQWQKGIGRNRYACLARRYSQAIQQLIVHKYFWYRIYHS